MVSRGGIKHELRNMVQVQFRLSYSLQPEHKENDVMSTNSLIQDVKFVSGIVPVRDFNSATVYTQVVNMRDYQHCTFLLYTGQVESGTSKVTCNACSNSAAAAETEIAFYYKEQSTTLGADSHGAETLAVVGTGFTLTAETDNQIEIIEVHAEQLAALGYNHVRLSFEQVVDDPRIFACIACLSGARQGGDDKRTVLV